MGSGEGQRAWKISEARTVATFVSSGAGADVLGPVVAELLNGLESESRWRAIAAHDASSSTCADALDANSRDHQDRRRDVA
jgi:hypothetical protein